MMMVLYIGPGLGGGALALVIGFLASTALFLFAILRQPIIWLWRRFKGKSIPKP